MNHVISHPAQAMLPLSRTLEAQEDLNNAIERDDLQDDEKQKLLTRHMDELARRKEEMTQKDVFPVQAQKLQQSSAEPFIPTQSKTQWRSIIIDSIPKNQRIRARGFLNYIEMVPDKLRWNDEGHLIVEGATVIPQSNIVDLVNYAVRDSLKRKVPHGWWEFINAIKNTNLPRDTALGKLGQAALSSKPVPVARTPLKRKTWSKVK